MYEEMSRKSRLVRALVAEFNSNKRLTEKYSTNTYGKSDMDEEFRYPEHLTAEKIVLGGDDEESQFETELLQWKDSDSPWVILHFHGGGYVGAMRRHYKRMAGLYSEVGHGATVLTVDYRVAPEHPFPAALDDAVTSYNWLLEQGYAEEQIVVAGDSAGGRHHRPRHGAEPERIPRDYRLRRGRQTAEAHPRRDADQGGAGEPETDRTATLLHLHAKGRQPAPPARSVASAILLLQLPLPADRGQPGGGERCQVVLRQQFGTAHRHLRVQQRAHQRHPPAYRPCHTVQLAERMDRLSCPREIRMAGARLAQRRGTGL